MYKFVGGGYFPQKEQLMKGNFSCVDDLCDIAFLKSLNVIVNKKLKY